MSLANYNAVGFYNDIFSAYFAASAETITLKQGYILCWDVLASISATDVKARLGNQVVKPSTTTTTNIPAFAGVVGPGSAGKVGSGYVDIIPHCKNRFFYGWMHCVAAKMVTFIGPANDDWGFVLKPTDNTSVTTADAAAAAQVAISADAVDTGTTAALGLGLFK